MQYHETLPLRDKEVVLTFDDGPLPPYSTRVLQALAAECVKATFFLVGRQARAYPDMVRRVYNAGHTVASHSQNHPLIFTRLNEQAARQEIELGIASSVAALGDERALAPFFRFPGLGRSQAIEAYLASRGIMVWSADFPADDWTHISGAKVMARALERLERKGKGVLLLHDIQPATAMILPQLLRELKRRGFHVVHVVPAGQDQPKTVTEPQNWVMQKPAPQAWPRIVEPAEPAQPTPPPPSAESFGWPHPFRIRTAVSLTEVLPGLETAGLLQSAPLVPAWSPAPHIGMVTGVSEPTLITAAPIYAFTDPSAPPSLPTDSLPEASELIVAPEQVFAEMIAPPPLPPAAKPRPVRPAAVKLRVGAAPATRPAAPMPLFPFLAPSKPPRLVAHTHGASLP
jgi:peptidoglycan/xylan/chitin deacetylase (PgdA/CDA1 family)